MSRPHNARVTPVTPVSRSGHAERLETRDKEEVRSVPRYARNGAPSAPSQIVAEYAKAAADAGNHRFLDPRSKAILAGQAKLLIHQDDWPLEAVVRAVRRFAGTQRNPAFLREWCRINAADEREAEHARFKAEERLLAPGVFARLGLGPLKHIPLTRVDDAALAVARSHSERRRGRPCTCESCEHARSIAPCGRNDGTAFPCRLQIGHIGECRLGDPLREAGL